MTCGPSWLDWLIPDLFPNACTEHDELYEIGGDLSERRNVDRVFRDHMLIEARQKPAITRWFYQGSAWIYWAAVRVFGRGSWAVTDDLH